MSAGPARPKRFRSWQGSNLRGQSPLDFKSNALTTRPQLPHPDTTDKQTVKGRWRCGGSNPGPFTCKANALPLSYIPFRCQPVISQASRRTRQLASPWPQLFANAQPDRTRGRMGGTKLLPCTHGGTRTPNLRFRRPTPYPLGHAGTHTVCLNFFSADIGQPPQVERSQRGRKGMLRRPGIEPGSQEWESCMIPLHQRRRRIPRVKLSPLDRHVPG